jgi:hypothetical protein
VTGGKVNALVFEYLRGKGRRGSTDGWGKMARQRRRTGVVAAGWLNDGGRRWGVVLCWAVEAELGRHIGRLVQEKGKKKWAYGDWAEMIFGPRGFGLRKILSSQIKAFKNFQIEFELDSKEDKSNKSFGNF